MKNKIKFLLPLLFLIFAIPVLAATFVSGKITNVEVTRVGEMVYLEGTTEGFASKMRVLIKVLDDSGALQFFDEVPVNSDGSFGDSFIPMNITEDTYLNINVSGDMAFTTKFYYSTEYVNEDDKIETLLLEQLQDYKYYKDDNSKYALNFVFSYEQGVSNANVILTGTNFVKGDALISGINTNTWNSYLGSIKNLSTSISGKTVTLYVYDKNNILLQTYPIVIGGTGDSSGGSGSGDGSSSGSGSSGTGSETTVDPDKVLASIGGEVSYKSNGNQLSFNSSLKENSDSRYIKVKFVGNFSKQDLVWTNSSLVDLENFSRSIAKGLKNKYNADFDFYFYDKNNKLLNSYSYYYYQQGNKGEETSGTTESGSGNGTGSNPVITPIPGSSEPETNSGNTGNNSDNGSYTDDMPIYKIWSPYDNLGVYALNLMVYSYNSSTIDATIESEGYEGATYKYNYVLNDYTTVSNIIGSLRSDSKKVLIVRGNTLGSNINFRVSADIVELLKSNNVTLLFDTSYLKIEADFETCLSNGEFTISTNEAIAMLTDKATESINIAVSLNGYDASNLFSNKIKLALHYTNESAGSVTDLRFVNIYFNNNTSLNTTVEQNLKAFITTYQGSGIYCGKANTCIFNDSNFEDNTYRRYAEIVVSRGIMNGSSGIFNPKQTLTRGEFISYMARKMGVSSSTNYFSDLSSGSSYFGAVNGAYEIGIVPPSWRNNCSIDSKITIEEMIYITVRCYEVNSLNSASYGSALFYRDVDDISAWAKNKVAVAAKLGFIPTDGYLYPTEKGTKEDAAELIFKLLDIEGLF